MAARGFKDDSFWWDLPTEGWSNADLADKIDREDLPKAGQLLAEAGLVLSGALGVASILGLMLRVFSIS